MKIAILQCADQGPAESVADMLAAVGYTAYLPNEALRAELRSVGCNLVLSPADLTRGWGYDPVGVPEIGQEGMRRCDLFLDVKAHQNHAKLVRHWFRLERRVLWYRINGGRGEHVIKPNGEDCGDEVNPPCPILTPNRWYALTHEECGRCEGGGESPPSEPCWECEGEGKKKVPWHNLPRYSCWPPFRRFADYRRAATDKYDPPLCLLHNASGWGYGALFSNMRDMGIRVHGNGSPDGLIQHREVPIRLSKALCMVHLKSSDAPGYALYEALASACPIVCTRRLIWRNRMQDLLVPGKTCLVFDRETHDALTPEDVRSCTAEVVGHLKRLRDPAENRRIGEAGRQRLREVMWDADNSQDVDSLNRFLQRHFP